MKRDLVGTTVLVTGANRGLGLETCRQLGRRGARVLLTSRGVEEGAAAAKRLAGEGLTVEHHALDVTSDMSAAALAGRLAEAGVALDVLVANAAITLDGFDAEVARRTLEVNFFGAMRVLDALAPLMPAGANVVMVSSGMGELSGLGAVLRRRLLDPELSRAGLVELMRSFVREVERGAHGEAGWPSSAYSVSKAGLNTLVRISARDLAPRALRVNAVCPGWVRTDMGGRHAPRSVEEGAASIVWAAALDTNTTGGFFRDGKPIPW
jgi:NAD(P)-dependent dehydrogenase (short-subunit alcohol dehydrogenase family)